MKQILTILVLTVLMVVPAPAGQTVGGIRLPEQRGNLQLQGAGLLRKGFFFKVYVGALYTEDQVSCEASLAAASKRIDIHFFHHTPRRIMAETAARTLEKNLTEKQLHELGPKIQALHEAYLNGKKGSVASIIYTPGRGLTYTYNDEPVITIDCDDFANAYFKVWLGDRPSSRSVKQAMLGGQGEKNG